jgi:hypothetical protein
MVLQVVERTLVSGIEPENASYLYVQVDPDYLRAYGIGRGDVLHGKIIGIRPSAYAEKESYGIEGKEIELIYDGTNRLYFSKESFKLFRGCGLVKPGFVVEADLPTAKVGGHEGLSNKSPFYPVR